MWDLDGLELTGVYGTWSERSYELADLEDDSLTVPRLGLPSMVVTT